MARAAGGEEALVGGIGFLEAGDEGGIDLVAGARDARADRGGDPRAIGAEAFHRGNRPIGDAPERALPPAMDRPHPARPPPPHTTTPPTRRESPRRGEEGAGTWRN